MEGETGGGGQKRKEERTGDEKVWGEKERRTEFRYRSS